jgi:hypothetical protein
MGLKRRANTISLGERGKKTNTPLWPGGDPPGPASFMGAGTRHAVTVSPVEQSNIVSKKNKKNKKQRKHTRGLRTHVLSPHCRCRTCGGHSGSGEGEGRGGGASGVEE